MNVEFTPEFVKHAKKIASKENLNAMSIHAKKVGCNGLAYEFTPVRVDPLSSDYFSSPQALFDVDDFEFYIPADQESIFEGSKFDYIREGLNYRVIVSNPNILSQCGCGYSFNVE